MNSFVSMYPLVLFRNILWLFCCLPFFSFGQASPDQYEVIIDEIMADPSPVIGLPEVEWIELKNISPHAVNLQGCRLAKNSSLSGPMPDILLQPDSFLIVCSGSALNSLSAFGRAISITSFPSLINTGDLICLRSPDGGTLHAVNYSDNWYENALKQQGGWSLEMINANLPCGGPENWSASICPYGGTPGAVNSIAGNNSDQTPPVPLFAFAVDSLHVEITFDEPLDSLLATQSSNYSVSDGIGSPALVYALSPLFNKVRITLISPLLRGKVYELSLSGVPDCLGNRGADATRLKLGLSQKTDSNDIVINEILFNPPTGGSDYVELYNRSDKVINLRELYLANRNSLGEPDNFSTINDTDQSLFPQEFVVLSDNSLSVMRDHWVMEPKALLELSSIPSFPDDKGNVIIMNNAGQIIDEVAYDEDWHFKLINNRENVALERINHDSPTSEPSSWHSAAQDAGFGTPTYKNSQMKTQNHLLATLLVEPPVFSPDNDGWNDIASLQYRFDEPGYLVNVTIFDGSGNPVRFLQKNSLAGLRGTFYWDGLDEKGSSLPSGIYIFFTEIFDLMGKMQRFKNSVVMGRR